MKVIFVGNPSSQPTDGGSATFQRALLAGLKQSRSAHEFFYVQASPGRATIQAAVMEKKADLVWFMSPHFEPVEVPFATTVWDLGHRDMPYFPEVSLSGWTFDQRESYYRSVLPRASIVVIGNNTGARKIAHYYQVPIENICEISLPVDLNAFQGVVADSTVVQSHALTPGEFLFYPAQFWPHKNHLTLVDALSILHNKGKRFKLVFSGSDKGNRGHVENYVARCGLQDWVFFAGFVEATVLRQFYLNAFAMVFASLLGPDNLPPLEAMALGCPVITATFDGAREQLGEAALFFDGLDANDAASQVLRLEDLTLRKYLLDKGGALIKSRGPNEYFNRIVTALDQFERKRRLWGPCNVYRHL